jgi:hypothetical protein
MSHGRKNGDLLLNGGDFRGSVPVFVAAFDDTVIVSQKNGPAGLIFSDTDLNPGLEFIRFLSI